LAWLINLRDRWPLRRDGTTTGFWCMHAGWTQWVYRQRNGMPGSYTHAEAREKFGDEYWNHVEIVGERLTEAGQERIKGRQ
jgi:hypothetical protein